MLLTKPKHRFLLNYQKEKKTIGFKWAYEIKNKNDGGTEKYMTCLVAKKFYPS